MLPQELIDQIIDHVHDEPAVLRSCSRVSHAWLPTSRFHLFAKISLKATSPQQEPALLQDRCKRLHHILQRSPSLIPNIRELEICEGSPLHHPNPDDQSSTTWVTTERTLTALFRMLTHVKRFDFSATSSLYWTLLPPTFQAALCSLLSLPTITYVRLHSWVFPNFTALDTLLNHSKNLKALALSSTTVCTDNPSPPRSKSQSQSDSQSDSISISLPESESYSLDHTAQNHSSSSSSSSSPSSSESLSLDVLTLDFVSFAHLEYWLLGRHAFINVRSLRELRIAHFHDVLIVDNLLRAIGASLEHFHLKPGMWNVYNFNLSHNPSLLSLRLTLENPETAMSWALSLLSLLISPSTTTTDPTTTTTTSNPARTPSPLHSINLEFYADPKKLPLSSFSDLQNLLLTSTSPQNLRQLDIGLFAVPSCGVFQRVQDELAGLRELRGCVVRCYRLGIRSERSSGRLTTPRISRYEAS